MSERFVSPPPALPPMPTRPSTPAEEIAQLEGELGKYPKRTMSPPTSLPDGTSVRIASPCEERWEAMVGDERVRHCSRCDRDVFNLGALTAEEIQKLLADRGVRRCVRLYRRHDGTMLTADCPVNRPRQIALRVLAVTAVAVGAGVAGASYAYYARQPRCRVDDTQVLMGEVSSRN
ncbi:MAG: hypothetical protein OHK0013_34040 [Sandaracinaceae bacterium]